MESKKRWYGREVWLVTNGDDLHHVFSSRSSADFTIKTLYAGRGCKLVGPLEIKKNGIGTPGTDERTLNVSVTRFLAQLLFTYWVQSGGGRVLFPLSEFIRFVGRLSLDHQAQIFGRVNSIRRRRDLVMRVLEDQRVEYAERGAIFSYRCVGNGKDHHFVEISGPVLLEMKLKETSGDIFS